jgi:hypothetical protein
MKKIATLTVMAFVLSIAGAFAQAPATDTTPAKDAATTKKAKKAGKKTPKKAAKKATTTDAAAPAAMK